MQSPGGRLGRVDALPTLYVIALLVTVVVLWHKVLTGQSVLIGGDILKTLPPWFTGGPMTPARNASLSDPASQFVPWLTLVRSAYAHGTLPLWNQTAFSGAPLLADDQSAPFSLFTVLALPFTPAVGYSLAMLAKLAIAASGVFLWLRQLGTRRLAAIVAGVVFATSSFMAVWLGHPQTAVAALFPWIFASVEWYLHSRGTRALVAVAAAVALQFLAGHAEATLDLGALLVFYSLVRVVAQGRTAWVAGASLVAAGVAGTALAGAQLIPFAAELHNSSLLATRAASQAGAAHLPLKALATWLIPNGLGNPAIDGAVGRAPNYLESAGFVGIGALCLAVLAPFLAWSRHRSVVVALVVSTLALVGVIYGVLSPIVVHLPLFSSANSVRLVVDLCLALAMLAGLGLDALIEWSSRWKPPTVVPLTALGLGLMAVAAVAGLGFVLAAKGGAVDGLLPRIHGQIGFWAVVALVSALAAVTLIGSMFAGAPHMPAAAGLAVLALVEGSIFAGPFQPQVPAVEVPPASSAIVWLQSHQGESAIAAAGLMLIPDTSAYYGLHDVRGVDLTIDPRVRLYWSHADPGYTDSAFYTVLSKPGTEWLAAAGVRYFLSEPGAGPPGSTPVLSDASFEVDAIPGARPFAFSATAVSSAPNSTVAVARLAQDPLGPVIVEHRGAALASGRATVTVTRRDPGAVDLRVAAESAATVTVLQSYATGWTATVDGDPTEIMPADGLFQAVEVPAGDHTLELRYAPASIAQGFAVSVAGAAVLTVLVAISSAWRRRRRPRDADEQRRGRGLGSENHART